jgi:hypothetical protein
MKLMFFLSCSEINLSHQKVNFVIFLNISPRELNYFQNKRINLQLKEKDRASTEKNMLNGSL